MIPPPEPAPPPPAPKPGDPPSQGVASVMHPAPPSPPSDDTNGGRSGTGGGGGTGDPFGTQAQSGQSVPVDGSPAAGTGGGSGGGGGDEGEHGGGGGFGTAGDDGERRTLGPGPQEEGLGGGVAGTTHFANIAGGSGGGGGSGDGNNQPRPGGGAGGGGGAILIFSIGNMTVRNAGLVSSDGGDGGAGCITDATPCDGGSPGFGGGGGGAGSGGGIILQSTNVTLVAASLSAAGGVGNVGGVTGDPAPELSGDGGEGRIRVDGLIPIVSGDIPGVTTPNSEYIGPAITAFNGTHLIGTGTPFANVNATIQNGVGCCSSDIVFS